MELLPNLLKQSILAGNYNDTKLLLQKGIRSKSWYSKSLPYDICYMLITEGHKVTIDHLKSSIKYRPDLVCLFLPYIESADLTLKILEKAYKYMNIPVIEACVSAGIKADEKIHDIISQLQSDVKNYVLYILRYSFN